MSTLTPNFNLIKPDANDLFELFRQWYNDNLDIIDANLGGGGGGDSVSWNQIQSSGTKIAEITINGTPQDVFAPTGGGGGSVNYSLNEQVIGTWINSKPLYQKTINFGAMPALNSSKTVNHGISDIDEVASAMFTVKRSGSIQYRTLPNVARSATQAQTLWYMNTTEIGVISGSSADVTSDFSGYVTIQYTKTTD